MTLTPHVRINEFGVHAFSPLIGEDVIGREVVVRDWYGEARFDCVGVLMGQAGYPASLEFEHEGKRRAFSLHSTREIEVLA